MDEFFEISLHMATKKPGTIEVPGFEICVAWPSSIALGRSL